MSRPIYWLGHPYEGAKENLDRAERWLAWCVRTFPEIDFAADWILWCRGLTEREFRERGLAFDAEMIRRLDGYIMVGGHRSAGMAIEQLVVDPDKRIVDLTPLGWEEPPDLNVLDAREALLPLLGKDDPVEWRDEHGWPAFTFGGTP